MTGPWTGMGMRQGLKGLNLLRNQNLILKGLEMSLKGFKQGSNMMVPMLQKGHQGSPIRERFKVCRKETRQ